MNSSTLYAKAWRQFRHFCQTHFEVTKFPASKRQVALYVTHLRHTGLKASSIRTHLSAIAFYHKIKDLDNPTDSFIVRKLLQGYAKKDIPIRTRKPITQKVLRKVIKSIHAHTADAYTSALFCAIFSLMYHAALRVSEVCSSSNSDHTLQVNQAIMVGSGRKCRVTICFKSYKHQSHPSTPLIVHTTNDNTCPVTLLQKYLRLRGTGSGPLFRATTGDPVHRSEIAEELKHHIGLIGQNPVEYNTHSFRIGKATDMAKNGFSITKIAMVGRWKSNAYTKYLKPNAIHC